MEFDFAYRGSSSVSSDAAASSLSFAPDTRRPPTFFQGELVQVLPFREAVSALHSIVVSDLRQQEKDRSAYLAWAAGRELADLQEISAQRAGVKQQIESKRVELEKLEKNRHTRWLPLQQAKQRYFDHLRKTDMKSWYVLDPVISVHPDCVFLECFSRDESSYGCLQVNYEALRCTGAFACGTTNIDYSAELFQEFQKLRSYKNTRFDIDPGGFEMEVQNQESFREVKIDLPDSWVRGFLQVSSAMSLPMVSLDLSPVDLHNLCFHLRRRKELFGPRSLRFKLKPGAPVRILLEPWNTELVCHRSIYQGPKEEEIRIWGRRRLHILERLIPIARKFTIKLLGDGMPSFYIADLGDISFTLGLSGWTANDWSKCGNFDLMAPRANTDDLTKMLVFQKLKENWSARPDELASRCGLDRKTVLGALGAWTQAGRAVYDLKNGLYRARELSRDTLPFDKLRFGSEREAEAAALVKARQVKLAGQEVQQGRKILSGQVKDKKQSYECRLVIDADLALKDGSCQCNFYQQNRLRRGPCAHMIALRQLQQEESR
ncbi:MAG: hypothetical protein RL095_2051 [Verrucomicrobiota bacterium]|jgi:hypothetical protein